MTPKADPAVRFPKFVEVDPETGCHQWVGSRDPAGYGHFTWNQRVGKAHRYAWEAANGPIPDGLTLDHLCRNRGCVNPEHLEPVTLRENILRGTSPVAANALRERCIHGHDDWRRARGKRECRACDRLRGSSRERDAAGLVIPMSECHAGHKFTPANTHISTTGRRVCRACQRVRTNQYQARQKLLGRAS